MNSDLKNEKSDQYIKIYLSDVWRGFTKFWYICVALAVLVGGYMFVKNFVFFQPMYKSTVNFTINTQNSTLSDGGITTYSYFYDSATAGQLSDIFPYILDSSYLSDMICDDLDVPTLPAKLTASSVEDSNMFTIVSSSSDPKVAYDTLISTIKNYPEVLKYVVGDVSFTIITEPQIATKPYNHSEYLVQTLLGLFIGFSIGFFCIIIYAVFRKTIRTSDEIRTQLNMKCIGIFPLVSFKKYNKEINDKILLTNNNIGEGFIDSLTVYRNTLLNSLKENERVIMVTSTVPSEGKTTAISNLAISLANINKKILVVDADLRNPSIKNLLGINTQSDYIVSETDNYQIFKNESLNIFVLSFKEKATKSNLLEKNKLKDIFDDLRNDYDYILVDTPPCGLVSDTMFIAHSVDTVLYVVFQDSVSVSKIRNSIDDLLTSDVKITGCILNGATSGISGYGKHYGTYGYKYGYYSKYGYGRKYSNGYYNAEDKK